MTMRQGSFVINAKGRVRPPPSIDDVLALVADAMVHKRSVTLKPNEVRILHNWLVMLEQGNPEKLIRSI